MSDILSLATQLGKAIADSSQGKAMKEAVTSLRTDPAALRLMQDYETQVDKISRLEYENKPIEVADKRAVSEMETKLAGNQRIKKFSEIQVEYMDLIRRVNQTIQGELSRVEEPEPIKA